MQDAQDALNRLHAGNKRFIRGETTRQPVTDAQRRAMAAGQEPEAAILCCSDSRVAPEIIFDTALGELFVVRVGGAVIDSVALASLEFAVSELSVPLILVLGHQHCGTVQLAASGRSAPGSLGMLTGGFAIPISQARSGPDGHDEDEVVAAVTRSHVLQTAESLRLRSIIISDAVARKTLHLASALYSIETGRVELLHAQ
jgi:carbonic anhydrase